MLEILTNGEKDNRIDINYHEHVNQLFPNLTNVSILKRILEGLSRGFKVEPTYYSLFPIIFYSNRPGGNTAHIYQ